MTGPLARVSLEPAGPRLDEALRALPGSVRVAVLEASSWDAVDARHAAGAERLGGNDLVTVAAVEGGAAGLGAQLALGVDLLVLGERAWLAFPEVRAGGVPGGGTTRRLVEAMGPARALEVCATGRPVGAAEAHAAGLAVAVVPAGRAAEAVEDLVASLLAAPRDAVVELKALLRGAAQRTAPEQCEAEREAAQRLRSS